MGIYDREYYRRDGPSFLGTLAAHGMVCKWLIIINVVVFVLQYMTLDLRGGGITSALILDADAVMHGQVWRLLTYAFLHATIWHILFNMLALWWFGTDLEDMYGPREFLAFYLLSAFLGGLAYLFGVLLHLQDALPCLGASGAIVAVLILYACHFPTRVIYLFMVVPVPAWGFALLMVGWNLYNYLNGARDGTAYMVHLGGAAFGFLYHYYHWRVLNWLPSFSGWQRQRARPNLRVYHDEEPAAAPVPVASAAPAADVDEQLEAKVDALLEKVARLGQNSLTDSERQVLMRASEVYRKRRS